MNLATIKKENGRWFLNGKTYKELNEAEKFLFDEFWIAMKFDFKEQAPREANNISCGQPNIKSQNHHFKEVPKKNGL